MNKPLRIVLAAMLGFAAILAGCNSSKTESTVTIGAILPFTGSSATAADYAKQGIALAVEQLNTNKSTTTPTIAVEWADSKNAAKDGLSAFNQLNSAKGIRLFIASNSGVVVPLSQSVGKDEDILLMTTFSSAPGVPQSGPNVFRLFVTAENEATAMSAFLIKKGIRKCAVFYINDDFGLGGLKVFSKEFSAAGGAVNWSESWQKGGSDFRSSLQKMPPDTPALYIIGYESGLGLSVKQAREAGFAGLIVTTVGMSLPPWRAAAGNAAEGVFFTNTDYTPDSNRPETKDFVLKFQAKYGSVPNAFSAFAYDLATSLGLAIQEAAASGKPTNAKNLSASIQAASPRPGVLGSIYFGAGRDANPALSIWTIKDGAEKPAE